MKVATNSDNDNEAPTSPVNIQSQINNVDSIRDHNTSRLTSNKDGKSIEIQNTSSRDIRAVATPLSARAIFSEQSNKILPLPNSNHHELEEIIDTRKNSSSDRATKFEGGSGQKSSGRTKQIP